VANDRERVDVGPGEEENQELKRRVEELNALLLTARGESHLSRQEVQRLQDELNDAAAQLTDAHACIQRLRREAHDAADAGVVRILAYQVGDQHIRIQQQRIRIDQLELEMRGRRKLTPDELQRLQDNLLSTLDASVDVTDRDVLFAKIMAAVHLRDRPA
jgi:chromosome segregation ATPase